ncbi:hypothetical protein PPYR_03287 [Photinus pyralis]|uniref:Large ribosomal subunit protein mL52 n=1 Tax=Photinus pyralis TaxID=7054 RepID=A0A5N4A2E3_PHOPY|nr:hypothetical protein PPYR_03287 [Photinus pyralis]
MIQRACHSAQLLATKCSQRWIPRYIHTTPLVNLDQRWREKQGLPMNPNASGVLTDAADYTYLDGRPTPYGTRQQNRILKQKEVAETIICLSKEIDFAVERHEQLKMDEEDRKRKILANKLKPKGVLLLRKGSK